MHQSTQYDSVMHILEAAESLLELGAMLHEKAPGLAHLLQLMGKELQQRCETFDAPQNHCLACPRHQVEQAAHLPRGCPAHAV